MEKGISMHKLVDITPNRKLLLSARNWSVVLWFDLEEVNYWFRFWLFQGKAAQMYSKAGTDDVRMALYYSFFRRLAFWLHECWGIGWDIRKRWSSEYNIRMLYLQLCIEFEQSKTNERADNVKFSE